MDEVVVTGSRIPIQRNIIPVPITVVDRNTIEQSDETNLLPVLMKYVPSLFVTSRSIAGYGMSGGSAGGINLRGFSGGAGRVLILIDGHPQYATIYGHPVADAYIASDAERVEVSRGSASILYGSNAMGGAINIITRKAPENGNNLSARLMGGSYGTQRYSVTDSYRNGKLSGVVSGNYERTDGHRSDMEFGSFSGYGKLGYEFSDIWKATGNVNIAKSNSQNPGSVTSPLIDNTADVLRGMSGLSIENNYGKTSGAVNLFYNWGNHEVNDGYAPGGNPRPYMFNSTDWMGGVNIYQTFDVYDNVKLTGGFDMKLYGGNAYRNPETEIYADHIKLHEIAGYVLAQQQLGRSMFEVGLRVEDHKLYGTEFIPQAGFSFKVADYTNLKLSASKGFRTPNLRELYMYASANEDLLPETSWSYDFTVSQGLLDNKMNAELTLYYIKGDNIVEVVQVDGRTQNRNAGEFVNKGIEFNFNYQIINNFAIHANYSYLSMETPITGAPRHKVYVGLTYNPGRFSFNLGAQVIGKLYTSTVQNNVQTSSYTLVDARVSYKALKWLDIFAKGDNLTARKYETMLGYPMPRATFMGGVSLNF
ncbi:MAG: TonB-dependent receptor [Dysgonomonas sp.]